MRIGIIGSGNIGSTLARLAVGAGVEVVLANSRGPASLRPLAAELGPLARAGTLDEAAAAGDLAVEAIPFGRLPELPREAFEGRVLVTAANYFERRDGPIELGGASQSSLVARLFPGARLVKAFNAIRWRQLLEQGDAALPLERRRAIPIAGDDAAAKERVAQLIDAIGFGPVDLGGLEAGRVLEPGGPYFAAELDVRSLRERLNAV